MSGLLPAQLLRARDACRVGTAHGLLPADLLRNRPGRSEGGADRGMRAALRPLT
ncbi:MAG: hypothetical protein AB7I19_16130 [Planctomycetota bacterium]